MLRSDYGPHDIPNFLSLSSPYKMSSPMARRRCLDDLCNTTTHWESSYDSMVCSTSSLPS